MKKQEKLLMAFLAIIMCAGICSCEKDDDSESGSNSQSTSSLKGHKYVDLGLSVKWATCNVGAETPEDYGDYYAWGEVEPKAEYNWSTYFDSPNRDGKSFIKYALDKKTTLAPEDDVAHVKWGGGWRMPTTAEQRELCKRCSWEWTSQGGVNGYVVTGPNGNSIFLPAAGYRGDSGLNNAGSYGYYWSSSLYKYDSDSDSDFAYYLYLFSIKNDWDYYGYRYYGQSVRPVCQ